MSEKQYPTRMHEVLGAEPNEEFYVDRVNGEVFYVNDNGHVMYYHEEDLEHGGSPAEGCTVCYIINHPECIIRRPRLSEEQVKKLHAALLLGFKWLTVNSVDELWLFGTKPRKFNLGWGENMAVAARIKSEDNSELSSLVSWSDPEPLDIVATLKAAGVEVE